MDTCTLCGNELAYLGTLGFMLWFRCIGCGMDHSHIAESLGELSAYEDTDESED